MRPKLLGSDEISDIKLDLTCLKELDFYSYRLNSIESNTFESLVNLEKLSLRANNLTRLNVDTFKGLLNLQSNQIEANINVRYRNNLISI